MADVTRVQFELDDDQIAELEELRELGGLRTKKDLLNNAITLLKRGGPWGFNLRG
jgi:Arc/MetJ family transcription regulator